MQIAAIVCVDKASPFVGSDYRADQCLPLPCPPYRELTECVKLAAVAHVGQSGRPRIHSSVFTCEIADLT